MARGVPKYGQEVPHGSDNAVGGIIAPGSDPGVSWTCRALCDNCSAALSTGFEGSFPGGSAENFPPGCRTSLEDPSLYEQFQRWVIGSAERSCGRRRIAARL